MVERFIRLLVEYDQKGQQIVREAQDQRREILDHMSDYNSQELRGAGTAVAGTVPAEKRRMGGADRFALYRRVIQCRNMQTRS